MNHSMYFARRLREARQKSGLSQKALGIKAGIDQFSASPRMNQYEKGKHLPDLLTVEHLATATGFPIPFFFAPEDELAELIAAWGQLEANQRASLLEAAKQLLANPTPPEP